MKKLFLILLICAFCTKANAQVKEAAFKSGEHLSYVVSYIAALVPNTDVAQVDVMVSDTLINNNPTFKISADAYVMPFFRWFYDLHDRYDTYMDVQTLRPIYANCDLQEGKYRFRSRVTFDWENMQAYSTYRNLRHKKDKHKTLPLIPESQDGISLYYNLRNQNIEEIETKANQYLHLVLEDTVRTLDYRYMGKEEIKVKGLGRFNSLKFSCTLTTTSGQSFEDGTELFIWISDDKNHVPLLIKTPIIVGSVRARLKNYSNLKYPFSSKIK